MKCGDSVELKYRIWFESQEINAFGYDLHNLLRYVKVFGSMNKACKAMGMSYAKASEIVAKAEVGLGFELVRRTSGGAMGGGSEITEKGLEIMNQYESYVEEADLVLKELYLKHFNNVF